MSVSEKVWLYIKKKPYLQEALSSGIVNYSASARLIGKDIGIKNYEAIKMALIRLGRKMGKERKSMEEKVLYILRKSKLELRDKISVIISYKKLNIPAIAKAKSKSGYTYIVNSEVIENIRKKYLIKIQKDLAMLTITSPEGVEETPGVISYLLAALANEGINVVEFVSCYKDTLLILKNTDATKAYEILSERMK
ncbi:MAG: ACT domain-containing protein [Candidatus Aenigmatarchaeota archaeon]